MYPEASDAAWCMVEIAEDAYAELLVLSTTGMHTSSGFIKSGFPDFHVGYDFLTDKGYMVGVCNASDAINLCQMAEQQKWFGSWQERIREIYEHEELLTCAKSIIRHSPGIVQSDLLKQHPDIGATTLYYAAIRGDILRTKRGRSYVLSLAEMATNSEVV